MNKRIKELYQQVVGKDWAYDFDPQVAEKFAELIVQECADRVADYVDHRIPASEYSARLLNSFREDDE